MSKTGLPVSEVTAMSVGLSNPRDMARDCVRNLLTHDEEHRERVSNPHSAYGLSMEIRGDRAYCEMIYLN
jgi:hypothetical protein